MASSRAGVFVLPAVLAAVAVAWSGVLGAGYVWDDRGLVLHNAVLDAPTWDGVFGSDLWRFTDGERTPYYRPMMTLSLLLDHALGGGAAVAHAQSLGWHLGCVGLGYGFLVRRVGAVRAAVAALVVGLHPVTSEAVAWVAARNDLLAAAGVLGAMVALDRGRPALAGAAALFALLSKESALVALPIALGLAGVPASPGEPRSDVSRRSGAIALGIAAAVWAALRQAADLGPATGLLDDPNRTPVRLLAQLVRAASWLVWPWPLTGTANLTTPLHAGTIGAAGVAVVGVGWLWARGGPVGRRAVVLAVAAALPAAFAVATYGTLGERYLYLPVAALALALGTALPAGLTARGAVWVVPLAVVAAVVGEIRVADFRDDATFFAAAAERQPDSYAAYLLGAQRRAEGDHAAALEWGMRSLDATPRAVHACRYVADEARKVGGADDFVALIPGWEAAGCRASPGFDGPVATQLLAWRRVGEARAWVAGSTEEDPSGRLEVARHVLAAEEGDLLGAAAVELASERPPIELRERSATLRLVRVDGAVPAVAPSR